MILSWLRAIIYPTSLLVAEVPRRIESMHVLRPEPQLALSPRKNNMAGGKHSLSTLSFLCRRRC